MSGLEPADRHAGLVVPPITGADGSSGGRHTVDIRMSKNKQHVAEFHRQRLFNLIHDALLKICSYERGRIDCYEAMPGAGGSNDD
jgi:hypothetical protein